MAELSTATEIAELDIGGAEYVPIREDATPGLLRLSLSRLRSWLLGTSSITALMDVDTLTDPPADGEALVWDDFAGQWVPGVVVGGGGGDLDGLSDVDTSTAPPADGDVLVWDDGLAQWVPGAGAGGGAGGGAVGLKGVTVLTRTAAQALTTSIWNDVTFDSEVYDNLGAFTSGTTFTVPAGVGWVRATAFLPWQSSAAGDRLAAIIQIAGSGPTFLGGAMQAPKNESFQSFSSGWIAVVPGDTYKMQAHPGSTALNLGAAFGGQVRLTLEWLGSITHLIASSAGGGGSVAGGGALELIDEVVTSASQATVDFSSIASTWRDLVLVVRGRGTAAATNAMVRLRFNGDSGAANYAYQLSITSNGASLSGTPDASDPHIHVGYITAATGYANGRGVVETTIYDYANTTHFKNIVADGGLTNDGTVGQIFRSDAFGYWKSTAAINQVTVLLDAGAFLDGSVVSLYGRKSEASSVGTARPWYWSPPVAADFTLASGDATMPTATDDADVGLILRNGGTTVAGPIRRIAHKPLPAGVSWTATAHIIFDTAPANYVCGGIMAYESSSGKVIDITVVPSVDATNRTFLDTHGGATATLTSVGPDMTVTREGQRDMWFRIVHDHAADTYRTYYSFTGKTWIAHIAATTAAALGVAHYDKIGFCFLNLGAGMENPGITCDHFVIT